MNKDINNDNTRLTENNEYCNNAILNNKNDADIKGNSNTALETVTTEIRSKSGRLQPQ